MDAPCAGRRRLGLRSLVDTALAAGAVSHAAVLAAQMLAIEDSELAARLDAARVEMAQQIAKKEAALQEELASL